MASDNQSMIELAVQCDLCDGKGGDFDPADGGGYFCEKCRGTGIVPTALGNQLLALLRYELRPFQRIQHQD